MGCNCCGGIEFGVAYKKRYGDVPFEIGRCRKCGLLQIDPLLEDRNVPGRYTKEYFSCQNPLRGGYENYVKDEPVIRRTFRRRLPLFLPQTENTSNKKLLDVGCATGVFLEVMRDEGWDVHGLDISPFAVEACQGKGLNVHQTTLDSVPFSPNAFHVITLWDVIEHLENPLAALRRCHDLLEPGGLLVLSTPDCSALLASILGGYWLGFRSVGEHLFFFGRSTITQMLEKAGFVVSNISAVGKYMAVDRLITRLSYYTRVFRFLSSLRHFSARMTLYTNSGDTMCVVARKA